VWLVTGTPFSTSLDQLKTQSSVLGHNVNGLQLKRGMSRNAAIAGAPGAVAPASEAITSHAVSFRNQERYVEVTLL
jgi:hypothetical protein